MRGAAFRVFCLTALPRRICGRHAALHSVSLAQKACCLAIGGDPPYLIRKSRVRGAARGAFCARQTTCHRPIKLICEGIAPSMFAETKPGQVKE